MGRAQLLASDGVARYVIVEVAYEVNATESERALRALIPELRDAGLIMTADSPSRRKWAGFIDADTYGRVAHGWALKGKPRITVRTRTERGELNCHAYTWDGMEWQRRGSSPVVWMRLYVSDGSRVAAS